MAALSHTFHSTRRRLAPSHLRGGVMGRNVSAFLAGLGLSALIGVATQRLGRAAPIARARLLDLNRATREQVLAIAGIDEDMADRILEHRPYRSKLDLVSQMVIPNDVYAAIKNRFEVRGADEAVKIA